MMSYYKARQEIQDELGNKPEEIAGYYVYKGGNLEATVYDKAEAKSVAGEIKGVIEPFISNQKEIDEWKAKRKQAMDELTERFHKELREEYSDLSDDIYNLIYNKAYEDGHSYGFDEVANYMIDLAIMARKIYMYGQASMKG
jgi:hypothetical protein